MQNLQDIEIVDPPPPLPTTTTTTTIPQPPLKQITDVFKTEMPLFELITTNITDLNPDCLERVFQYCDLCTQIKAAQACTTFYEVILERIWSRNKIFKTFHLDLWLKFIPNYAELRFFVHAMCEKIISVQVGDDCLDTVLKDFDDLHLTCLPNAERFEQLQMADCLPSNEDLEKLRQLLPNMKCLRLLTPMDGQYLVNFINLEELHLYQDCDKQYEITQASLDTLCTTLTKLRVLDIRCFEYSHLCLPHVGALQNLEVLKCNLNTLKTNLDDILALPKLQTLTILLDWVIDVRLILNVDRHDYKIYETSEFYKILHAKADVINGLYIDCFYLPLKIGWDNELELLNYSNLLHLAICNIKYKSCDVLLKYTKMYNLTFLSLRCSEELNNDTVLEFVKKCPNLIDLDIGYCKQLDKQLLFNILKVLENRENPTPLNIYYVNSGLHDEVDYTNPVYWREQKLINLISDLPAGSDDGLSYIYRGYEIHFKKPNLTQV